MGSAKYPEIHVPRASAAWQSPPHRPGDDAAGMEQPYLTSFTLPYGGVPPPLLAAAGHPVRVYGGGVPPRSAAIDPSGAAAPPAGAIPLPGARRAPRSDSDSLDGGSTLMPHSVSHAVHEGSDSATAVSPPRSFGGVSPASSHMFASSSPEAGAGSAGAGGNNGNFAPGSHGAGGSAPRAELMDAAQKLVAKAMQVDHCAAGVAPAPAPTDGGSGVPTRPVPRLCFHLGGTPAQVAHARGIVLQEMPLPSQVVLKVPRTDLVAPGGGTAPGSDVLRGDVRQRLGEIMQASGTNISVSQLETRGVDVAAGLEADRSAVLTIVGSVEAIEFARVRVLVLLDELSQLHVESVELDRKLLYASSGRKRAAIQAIEQDTETSVYMTCPFAGLLGGTCTPAILSQRNVVYVSGAFYNVQRAREMLLQLVSGASKSLVSRSAVLLPRKADRLLGEQLEELRAVMLDNGTFIEMPPLGSQGTQTVVYGTSRVDVERSIRSLMQLVSPYYVASVWLGVGTYDPLGLGTGNADTSVITALLVHIAAHSGAEVALHERRIDLVGHDAEVRGALQQLLSAPALKHYKTEFRFQLELANEHREFISGKKNGKINKIMEQCDVRIKFEPFNDYNFFIEVSGTELDGTLQGLGLLQEELPAEMSFHVPEAYHKRIIGVGGKNIQRIMKKYGVYVKFSNADEFAALGGYIDNEDNVIARTPSKNAMNLENLKNSVMELVSPKDKDFVTEAVYVPHKYHRMLLGKRASALRETERVTRCVIRFTRREAASDVVLVYGPESQIPAAVQMLLRHVPLVVELGLPPSRELAQLLDAPDFASYVSRAQKELGVSVSVAARSPECLLRFELSRAGIGMLPVARSMLDELCAAHSVPMHVPSASAAASAAPGTAPSSAAPSAAPGSAPPFASRFAPPNAALGQGLGAPAAPGVDTFHHGAAATAASVAAAGTRHDEPVPTAPAPTDIKALFEQPNTHPSSAPYEPASTSPHLMSPFYTPGYSESGGLSSDVWGAPLPTIPNRGNSTSSNSMLSPFSASAVPFRFPLRDPGAIPSVSSAPMHAPRPIERPHSSSMSSAQGVELGGGSAGASRPTALHHAPPGAGAGGLGNDIDGFAPIDDRVPVSSLGPIGSSERHSGHHRPGTSSASRISPSLSTHADGMDEVSRVLAQIAFDKR